MDNKKQGLQNSPQGLKNCPNSHALAKVRYKLSLNTLLLRLSKKLQRYNYLLVCYKNKFCSCIEKLFRMTGTNLHNHQRASRQIQLTKSQRNNQGTQLLKSQKNNQGAKLLKSQRSNQEAKLL